MSNCRRFSLSLGSYPQFLRLSRFAIPEGAPADSLLRVVSRSSQDGRNSGHSASSNSLSFRAAKAKFDALQFTPFQIVSRPRLRLRPRLLSVIPVRPRDHRISDPRGVPPQDTTPTIARTRPATDHHPPARFIPLSLTFPSVH